jgi:hypothetical protein
MSDTDWVEVLSSKEYLTLEAIGPVLAQEVARRRQLGHIERMDADLHWDISVVWDPEAKAGTYTLRGVTIGFKVFVRKADAL